MSVDRKPAQRAGAVR